MSVRRAVFGWLMVGVAAPVALSCSSLLGIEDLHGEDPPGGGGASGASGSSAGGAGVTVEAGADARAGSAGAGGTAGGTAGTGNGASAAAISIDASVSEEGGADGAAALSSDATARDVVFVDAAGRDASSDARDSGAADGPSDANGDAALSPDVAPARDGGDPAATIVVQGHLIDAWRHDVPGVFIAIADQSGTTDATGHFSFSNVVPPYDARVIISGSAAGNVGTQGWFYQGLRRADPTLQAYIALRQSSSSVVSRISNVTFPMPVTSAILLAFGSPDGSLTFDTTYPALEYGPVLWRGPSKTTGTLHGLRVTNDGSQVLAPPTGYQGYDAQPATFDDAAATPEVTLDLRTTTIASAAVTGVVASTSSTSAQNDAWLTFGSGASMHVVSTAAGDGPFSYLMPTLPGAAVVISAQRGSWASPPYAVAHRDGLAPGANAGTITVPPSAAPTLPVRGATGVTGATPFSWTATTGLSVAGFSFDDVDVNYFVVTTGTTARMPTFPGTGYDLPRNAPGVWHVETYGPYTSIDEAAGPTGMVDAFRGTGEYIRPPTPSRFYTDSESRAFTTAP